MAIGLIISSLMLPIMGQVSPPGGATDSCQWILIHTETDSTGWAKKYERYEFPEAVRVQLPCKTDPCATADTATTAEQTATTTITHTSTESGQITGGVIALFKLLTGTSVDFKANKGLTTTLTHAAKTPATAYASGQKVWYFWSKQFLKTEEERVSGSNTGKRVRTTESIVGYRGAKMGINATYDKCTDVLVDAGCPPIPCPTAPGGPSGGGPGGGLQEPCAVEPCRPIPN